MGWWLQKIPRLLSAVAGLMLVILAVLLKETFFAFITSPITALLASMQAGLTGEWIFRIVVALAGVALIAVAIGLGKIQAATRWVSDQWRAKTRQIERLEQANKQLTEEVKRLTDKGVLLGKELEQLKAEKNALETQERWRTEDAYQEYENEVAQWILDLDKPLREAPPEDPRRQIARQKTQTVLKKLDPSHKRDVLQFLYTQGLIYANNPSAVVTLNFADFSGARLTRLWLSNAHLVQVNLRHADLSDAQLCGFVIGSGAMVEAARRDVLPYNFAHPTGCDLTNADLSAAILTRATLAGCDLNMVNFEGANLERTDFRAADLQMARNLTQEQVDQAYGSCGHELIEDTQLPEGLKLPPSWKKLIHEQKRERGKP